MPRTTRRIPINRHLTNQLRRFGKERLRLTTDQWTRLESKLGQSIEAEIRDQVEAWSEAIKMAWQNEKHAIPVGQFLRDLDLLAVKAMSFRRKVGLEDEEHVRETTLEGIELSYFKKPLPRWGAEPMDPILALGRALDALIETCGVAAELVKRPSYGVADTRNIPAIGAEIKNLFESAGLPHTIRQDTDKMKVLSDSSGSAFIDFLEELLAILECPYGEKKASALASAVNRAARADSDSEKSC